MKKLAKILGFSLLSCLVFVIGFVLTTIVLNLLTPNYIESGLKTSVTVIASDGQGSGIVFRNGSDIFVWTAAHVVSHSVNNNYSDVEVLFELFDTNHNRKIGYDVSYARIIKYSAEDDIALLHLYRKDFNVVSATFLNEACVPSVGSKIFHIGSIGGKVGHNSYVEGVVSCPGHIRGCSDNCLCQTRIWDLMSFCGYFGSSGGGVFNYNSGECIGIVSKCMTGETFNHILIVPTRRIWEFAHRENCEWAMSRSYDVPEVIPLLHKECAPNEIRIEIKVK